MPTSPSMRRLLDLNGRSARRGTFSYEVLDKNLDNVGWLTPLEVPRIDNNADRPVKRTLSGLRLAGSDWDELDIYRHRLRPRYVAENGETMPLGVFVFGPTDTLRRSRRGTVAVSTMSDLGVQLDQSFGRATSILNIDNVAQWLGEVLEQSGITRYQLDAVLDTTLLLGNMTWPARGNKLAAINIVGSAFGALPLYFGNGGRARLVRPKLLDLSPIRYALSGPTARIFDGTAVDSEDPTRAPNVFVVIDTEPKGGRDRSVRRRIPKWMPHSVERRGYEVVKVDEVQGLRSGAQARRRARQMMERTKGTHETATFVGPPDPRHDTYNTVVYNGKRWREASWSLECREGGAHRHELRRHYLDADIAVPDPLEWEIPFPDSGGIVVPELPDEELHVGERPPPDDPEPVP